MTNNLDPFSKQDKCFLYLNILGSEDIDLKEFLGITDDLQTIKKFATTLSTDRMKQLQKYSSEWILTNYSNNNYDTFYNPFQECINNNQDKFFEGLLGRGKKVNLNWRGVCSDLLIEAVKIYATPYTKDYYIRDNENNLKYIGTDYNNYLENLYSLLDFTITSLIPYSKIKSKIHSLRIYETLEPNRDYILFNDCLLNLDTGKTEDPIVTKTCVPYHIIPYNYKEVNTELQEKVRTIFNKIDKTNIIISIMYGMFNRRVLGKTRAIFNIQKSNMGKTTIVTPFTEMGLFNNVGYDMLEGSDKISLFKQYHTVVFEEMQDSLINGGSFNSLIDNTSITIKKLYSEPITIPKELKPVILINGESMVNFKGRTQGTFNRFVFIPNYEEPITEKDYKCLDKDYYKSGIEILRLLVDYRISVGKDIIKENIQRAKKSEKEIIAMKENKLDIIFEYIKQEPKEIGTFYCLHTDMLVELIEELQERKIITVNLFNDKGSIRNFIKNTINTAIDSELFTETDSRNKRIIHNHKHVQKRLKPIYQLTTKGCSIISDLGYKLDSLKVTELVKDDIE